MSGSRENAELCFYKKAKGNVWLDDETEILVQLYGEELARTPTVGKYRPIQSYVGIARKLKAIGYDRSAHQIRNKIKALRTIYYAAQRGSDLDRQRCFMYDELDKYFSHASDDGPHNPDDIMQLSSDDPSCSASEASVLQKRRRQYESANMISNHNDNMYEGSEGEIHGDFQADCDDDDEDCTLPATKRNKRANISTTTNIERISLNEQTDVGGNLIEFMAEQMEKQRQHQLDITRIFTNAMTEQFKKFSDLITSLTHQMFEYSRKTKDGGGGRNDCAEHRDCGISDDISNNEHN